jgi:hypothetical protein
MLDLLVLGRRLDLVFSSFQKAVFEKEDKPCVVFFFFASVEPSSWQVIHQYTSVASCLMLSSIFLSICI